MKVTVYSKPSCVACDATKRLLTKLHILHTVIDITEDAEALAYVKSLGYSGAPVVVAETSSGLQHWSEFRNTRIKRLCQEPDTFPIAGQADIGLADRRKDRVRLNQGHTIDAEALLE